MRSKANRENRGIEKREQTLLWPIKKKKKGEKTNWKQKPVDENSR